METIPQNYDVIIVGAGMVGATLACALASSALRIAVLDAQPLPADPPLDDDLDLRVSAITQASQRVFTAVGAWPGMAARRMCAFREMHVWDAGSAHPPVSAPLIYKGEIHFDSADIGASTLGHIIENRVIQAALLNRLRSFGNITLLCPASVASVVITHDGAQVGLGHADINRGRPLTAALVVGADGAHSKVRQLAGIATRGWSYAQKGVVATVKTTLPHRDTAWQRFLPSGPLAFLPLHDGRCSIVWSTTPEHADALVAMDENAFLAALEHAFGDKLGKMIPSSGASHRAAFPLHLQHANAYTAPRLALIGDAAHTLHPLAGQGVNLGVLDAATLAEVILDAYNSGKDIGAHGILRRYERWRKGDNLAMLAVMDGFKRLFSNDLASLHWLRTQGLRLTHRLPPVKNLIMRHAMGLAGDLPKIALRSPE